MKVLSLITAALLAVSLNAQAKHITLTTKNTVAIQSEIDDESMADAELKLMKLVAQRGRGTYPIYIVLDSPGGSISSGLAFIDFVKAVPNVETVTLFAASMASSIVEALPGARNITDSGILMFHRAKGGVEGQFEDGELESELSFYKSMVRGMEQVSADRMKMPLSTYKASVKDEMWILGRNAVARHAADEAVTVGCSMELAQTSNFKEVSVFGMAFRIELNGCPVIKSMKVERPGNKESLQQYLKQIQWRK